MPTTQHLKSIIESAIDFAIVVTDLDGLITDWNTGAESILGWRRNEIVGAPAARFFTPEDRQAGIVDREMQLARETGRAGDDRWHLHKDGSRFWASGEMMPLRTDDGAHKGYVKILRDLTRQREAAEKLRQSEDRYGTVMELIDTAFAFVEVKFDANDQPIDYRFLDANPAFERQAGVDLKGKWVTEFAPNLEQFWFDTYGRVAKTGEPANFESHAKAFGRWFDVKAIRVGNPHDRQIAIFFTDSTARHQLLSRNAAIQELSDRLADVTTPTDIAFAAAEVLGVALEASLVGYGTVDPEAETVSVEKDWAAAGLQPLPRVIHVRDYGSYIEDLHSGETVIVPDAATDPRTRHKVAALEAIGARSFINLPIFEHGQFVALLYVGQAEPRRWTEDEVLFLRDVAERIRAATARAERELALRNSDVMLRRAQEAGGVGLFSVDITTNLLTPTSEFCRLYGLPVKSQYLATDIESCVVPEDRHLTSTAETRRRGQAYSDVEYRIRRADTSDIRWIARNGKIEFDEHGRPIQFVGAARDVTDRRTAEDRTQLALAAGAIIGTWMWHIPTDRFTIDEAFARAFGLDPGLGREGLSLAQIVATVHPDDQTGLADAIAEAVERGGHYAHQYRVRRADGAYHWIEANGRVDLGPEGEPLSFPGVLLDIESRRAVEAQRDRATEELRALTETLEQRVQDQTQDLMRAEEKLRQSQKMEAVGQLTGGLAHDFNNLLAGISGSLELMSIRLDQGRLNDLQKYMGVAQEAAKRAAALTHRLLAFSRRQTLAPRPTDVNALVSGMIELTQRTVGPSVEIKTVLAANLWAAQVDGGQLENAVLNLCINARDAMPEGGQIIIETSNRDLNEAEAAGRDLTPGAYLVLSVTDNGSGMSPDVIAQAFDPFFTTKPLGEGTGLGLSMIYGFAKQSGGQVSIHSTVNSGTTVSIFLPRHQGLAHYEPPAVTEAPQPLAEDGETVLIVDDEASVRMLVGDVLKDLGYTCIEAADGVAGMKVLQSDVRVDLLITDVGLPGGLNGRQMADAAKLTRSDLKVLFITGYAESAVVRSGQLEPGMQILTKPFSVTALSSKIRELLRQTSLF